MIVLISPCLLIPHFPQAPVVKSVMTVFMETLWENTALANSASPASVMATWTRTLWATVTGEQGSAGSAWTTALAPTVKTVKLDTTTTTPQSHARVQMNTNQNIILQTESRSTKVIWVLLFFSFLLVACNCNRQGSVSNSCSDKGQCECKEGYDGLRCEESTCPSCFNPVKNKVRHQETIICSKMWIIVRYNKLAFINFNITFCSLVYFIKMLYFCFNILIWWFHAKETYLIIFYC